MNFSASNGGTLDLPALTQATGDVSFSVDGSGTDLSLPSLASVAGTSDGRSSMKFSASNGGTLDLPALTQATGELDFFVDGSGSELSLPSLASVGSSDGTPYISFCAGNGGTLDLPALTQATGDVVFSVDGSGTDLSLPSLASVAGSSDGVGTMYVSASNGGTLDLPVLTQATGELDFESDGAGSKLSLPSLASVAGSSDGTSSMYFRASNGGTVDLPVLTRVTGTVVIDVRAASSVVTTDVFLGQGVALTGTGTITGNVDSAATIEPGDPDVNVNWVCGDLTIDGNYVQENSGQLEINIAGATDFSRLTVTGSVTLDGTLSVSLLGGFLPKQGDSFEVMDFASRQGDFSQWEGLDLSNGLMLDHVYDEQSLILRIGVVSPATPTLVTTASPADATLGSGGTPTLSDSAVLSGGNDPTGTITFTLTGPSGTVVHMETDTVNDNGTYTTPTGYTLPTSGTVAGTYTWSAKYTSADQNNNDASDQGGSDEQTVIGQASATIDVQGYTGVYDGQAHGATGTATGVNGEDLTGLLSPGDSFIDVPGGTATWSFAGNQDYARATGTAQIVIDQASATIDVQGYTGVYDGQAHGATGTATGVNGEDLTGLLSPGDSFIDVPGGTATWSFAGNRDYAPATGTAQIVINPADTTVILTSSTDPFGSTYGEAVTFTATVNVVDPGAGTPTGQVDFFDGDSLIGSGHLSGSVATFTTSDLTAGDHPITARYEGDGKNFNPSSSDHPYIQSVARANTSIIGRFGDASVYGQTLTIQAIVSVFPSTPAPPDGDLYLYDTNGTILDTAPLNGVGYDFSRSDLSAGTHTLTVLYTGDENFKPSDVLLDRHRGEGPVERHCQQPRYCPRRSDPPSDLEILRVRQWGHVLGRRRLSHPNHVGHGEQPGRALPDRCRPRLAGGEQLHHPSRSRHPDHPPQGARCPRPLRHTDDVADESQPRLAVRRHHRHRRVVQ